MKFSHLLASMSLAASLSGHVTLAEEAGSTDLTGWSLVWADEFDGTSLDTSKWSHEVDCWGGGNDERQCYTARTENVSVANGLLTVTARRETAIGPALPPRLQVGLSEDEAKATRAQPFTSGRINTKGKADFLYGRIEARARAPYGQGVWSAIWMLPAEDIYGGWAASGEIDIMEAVNLGTACKGCGEKGKQTIYGTVHFGAEWPRNQYKGGPAPLPESEDGFHVYSVEWEPGEIRWYLDGSHYLTLTSKDWGPKSLFSSKPKTAPFDHPFYLIINLAIGGNLAEETGEGGVSLAGYPKQFDVDWIRVYQRPDQIGTDSK
jgi:beta-glucanase (GH16 family)